MGTPRPIGRALAIARQQPFEKSAPFEVGKEKLL
jgi:hypothetical protein